MSQTSNISIKQSWKEFFNSPVKRSAFIGGGIVITAIIFVLPPFFHKIESRKGIVLDDWLLAALPSHNFSIAIFSILYLMGALMAYRAIHKPILFLQYVWTLIFVLIARFISIELVPLDPPVGLVQLNDPVNEIFYGHITVVKDLFFSGHTATLMLIFLSLEKRSEKIVALCAMVLVMILLLIQHIHYTIDVLAAPVIVYVLFNFTKYLLHIFQQEA